MSNLNLPSEPSQEGVIPPEFRSHSVHSSKSSFSPEQDRFSAQERKTTYHNWSSNPVEMWSKEQVSSVLIIPGFYLTLSLPQVANWLLALSMEMYIPRFLDSSVDGEVLLTLDSPLLKQLGVINNGLSRWTTF